LGVGRAAAIVGAPQEGAAKMSVGLIIHIVLFALAFLTAAYLVFATAQKSEGLLKSVGTILAAVLAALGVLALIGHLTAPMTGGRPFGIDMEHGSESASSPSTATSAGAATTTGDAAKPSTGGGSDEGGSAGGAKP
jgi:formate-dependent nitrite reductase membrane component NrfD